MGLSAVVYATVFALGVGQFSIGVNMTGAPRHFFYHKMCVALLGKIVIVEIPGELFSYAIGEESLKLARVMDGKLLLVTDTPDFTSDEVVKRYKSLANIKRWLRVLNSEIEIDPFYHRLPNRIRAHAANCLWR